MINVKKYKKWYLNTLGDEVMRKNKGYTLVATVIIMMVLVILGTTVLTIALGDIRRVIHQEKRTKAYYTAYSAADSMASYISSHSSEAEEIISKTSLHPATGLIDGNQFEVYVTRVSDGELMITATGYSSDSSPVTVNLSMVPEDSSIFRKTIFTNGKLDIAGNTTIVGDIGTNAETIILGEHFSGKITLGPGAAQEYINSLISEGYTVDKLSSSVEFPEIDQSLFASASVYTPGTNVVLSNGEKRYMKTTDLNKGMNVTGNGELHLLVTGSFILKGNSSISTPGNQAKVYVYYTGSSINFKGTPSFRGVIYAPNADMVCNGGGNGNFIGSIVCKSFNGPQSAASSIRKDPELQVENLALINSIVYTRAKWSK